ncbi:hypothetical protein D3C73_940100 [compost metagenome]
MRVGLHEFPVVQHRRIRRVEPDGFDLLVQPHVIPDVSVLAVGLDHLDIAVVASARHRFHAVVVGKLIGDIKWHLNDFLSPLPHAVHIIFRLLERILNHNFSQLAGEKYPANQQRDDRNRDKG